MFLMGLLFAQVKCTVSEAPGFTSSTTAEPPYANEITETILRAIDSRDYVSFSLYFDDEMKKILPENAFLGLHNLTTSTAGKYLSKEVLQSTRNNDYIVVQYRGVYSKNNADITIKVVFKESGNRVYVSGFWLESPDFAQ